MNARPAQACGAGSARTCGRGGGGGQGTRPDAARRRGTRAAAVTAAAAKVETNLWRQQQRWEPTGGGGSPRVRKQLPVAAGGMSTYARCAHAFFPAAEQNAASISHLRQRLAAGAAYGSCTNQPWGSRCSSASSQPQLDPHLRQLVLVGPRNRLHHGQFQAGDAAALQHLRGSGQGGVELSSPGAGTAAKQVKAGGRRRSPPAPECRGREASPWCSACTLDQLPGRKCGSGRHRLAGNQLIATSSATPAAQPRARQQQASRCLIPAAGSTDCAGEIILLAHLAQLAVLALLPSQHYLSASGSGGSHDSQRSGAARSPCVDRGPPGCREWCDGGKGKHGCLVWPAAGAGSGRAGSAGGGRQRTCRRWRRRCCRAARSPRQVPHRSGSDALRLGSGQLLPAGCCGERYRHGEAGSECWACRPPPGMWEIGV